MDFLNYVIRLCDRINKVPFAKSWPEKVFTVFRKFTITADLISSHTANLC
jgi:hypothetical protein